MKNEEIFMHTKNDYSNASIFLFLISMYSIGTVSAIIVSWTFTLLLLILAIGAVLIIANHVKHNSINSYAAAWSLITIVCLLSTMHGGSKIGLFFYILCAILLLCSSHIDSSSIVKGLKLLVFFGIVFSVGCYWQYLFPDQYYSILFPHFGSFYQESISRQFTYHKMCTGFTSQTAVVAQFIIMGIMAMIYYYLPKIKDKKKGAITKFILIIVPFIFLIGGLLLTGKRSPILNFAVAYFVVDIFTVKRSKRFSHLMRILIFVCIVGLILYFIAPLFSESRNSIVRLMEFSTEGADTHTAEEGDFSNGRLFLAGLAINEFLDNPIWGIGWGKFAIIYDISGAHNIYLQLLCECGIIGFIIVIGAMFYILLKTYKMLRFSFTYKLQGIVLILKCSLFIQIYILVYGFLGNPIYDQNYLLMYVFGLLLGSNASANLNRSQLLYPKIIS